MAGIDVILREVLLKEKPASMLEISPKAQVPVLQLVDGRVIEQSLEIMTWAFGRSWINPEASRLLAENDGKFKQAIDGYKYPERSGVQNKFAYRNQGELFLSEINQILNTQKFLNGDTFGGLDCAILPFVRQFSAVDTDWFETTPYAALRHWLNLGTSSKLFTSIMHKHVPWQLGDAHIVL